MFKVGDRIIYNGKCKDPYIHSILEKNRIYIVSKVFNDDCIYLDWERNNTDNGFYSKYFISVVELRNKKINKIKKRLCLKKEM